MSINIYSQNWENIPTGEEFPETTWEDMKNAYHPSLDNYTHWIQERHEKAKIKYNLKSYSFDAEQGSDLDAFAYDIISIIALLPNDCTPKQIKKYLNTDDNRWTVDAHIKNKVYSFSTQAISGIFMDINKIIETLNKIISENAPSYKVILPNEFNNGQYVEILIEENRTIELAAKNGFCYPYFDIHWNNPFSEYMYLFIPEINNIDENKVKNEYIKLFNSFAEEKQLDQRLTNENFKICNVVGNCHLYIFNNGKVIATPNKYENMVRCDSSLAEYLFAYTLANVYECDLFLENLLSKQRKKISTFDLEQLIKSNFK